MTKWNCALGQQSGFTCPLSAKTRIFLGKPSSRLPWHTLGPDQNGLRGIEGKAITQISRPDNLMIPLFR